MLGEHRNYPETPGNTQNNTEPWGHRHSRPVAGDIRRRDTIPTFAVLTSSDQGAEGKREDIGGDAVVEMVAPLGFELAERAIVPDERDVISSRLAEWADAGVDLICTTGGTGVSPRDVTPEATADVIDMEIPGIAEAMRARTFDITPMSMISRARAGARGNTLIVNLPGNPRAVRETLEVILPVLVHTVEVLQNRRGPHPVDGSSEAAVDAPVDVEEA